MIIFAKLTHAIFVTIFIMLPGFVLGSQTDPSSMLRPLKSVIITDSDNGGRVQIAPGGIVKLKLKVIPGTGYAWQVSEDNLNPLKQLGEPIFEEIGKGKVGAIEYQVFRFRALARGSKIIRLQYVREWEKDVAPLNTYSVMVQIR